MKRDWQPILWSRRRFVKKILAFMVLPISMAIGAMLRRQKKLVQGSKTYVVKASEVADFLVLDAIIITRQGNNFLAFENRCTHLGCRIREVRDGLLHCPCHGSRFNKEGMPAKGPAASPLSRLPSVYSSESGKIWVRI